MRKSTTRIILAAGLAVLLIVAPLGNSRFFVQLLVRIMLYGFMAMAFSFMWSQLGTVSLMLPSFMGITAYFIAITETREILRFPVSAIGGIVLSTVFAAAVGLIVIRTKGTYFLMLTLVLGQLVWALALQMVDLTKGTTGIIGVRAPIIFGIDIYESHAAMYYFTLILFGLGFLFLTALMRSPFGLSLRGIKESESRMAMLGYNVTALKWCGFVASSFAASLAGVVFPYFTGLMNPDLISLMASVQVMLASIVGGVNSLFGVILGTGIVKVIETTLSRFTQRYILIIGILFMLIVLFLPNGAVSLFGPRERSSMSK